MDLFVGFGTAQAHGKNIGPCLHGPADAGDNVLGGAGTLVVEDLGHEDFGFRGDSDDPVGVTAGGDDARDVGAVALGVVGGGGTAGEVTGCENRGF